MGDGTRSKLLVDPLNRNPDGKAIEGLDLSGRAGCKDIAAWARLLVTHPWLDILPHGMDKVIPSAHHPPRALCLSPRASPTQDMLELAEELEAHGVPDKSIQPLEAAPVAIPEKGEGEAPNSLLGPDPVPIETALERHGGDDAGLFGLLVSETVTQGRQDVTAEIWEASCLAVRVGGWSSGYVKCRRAVTNQQ